MSVTIIHKKGSGIPSADSLEVAEIAVDVVTGKLYTKTDDGNVVEISPDGDGDGIPAEFDPEFTYNEPFQGEEVGAGPVWVVEHGLSASFIHTDKNLSAKNAEFREVKAPIIDTHAPLYGSVYSAAGIFTEAVVLGGINIPAVDEDRPGDLPFDLSDEEVKALKDKTRSIQYALTVTHETLGRTVEIDKEGIIRANQFTDMDGNPIGGGGDPEWAILNSSGTEFRLGYKIDRGDTANVFVGHGISASRGSNNVAIGKSTTIEGSSNVLIGQNINTNMASDSVAIGRNSQIRDESVAIGYGAKNTGDNSIALGYNAIASRNQFAISTEITTAKFLNAQVQAKSVDVSTTVKATDFLDAEGNSIIGSGLPEDGGEGAVLTRQNGEWKSSDRFFFQEGQTNSIRADSTGITLRATDSDTCLKLGFSNFEFTHDYEPARVYIKKNPYIDDPSQLFVDEVHATDFLDADGNSIIGGGGVDAYTKTESDAKYEPKFGKNTAFNKAFGTAAGTVAQGNHNHDGLYLKSFTESDPVFKASPAGGITQTDINKWNNPPAGGKTYSSANGVTVNNTDNTIKMSGSYSGTFKATENWNLATGDPAIVAKGNYGGGIALEDGTAQSGFYAENMGTLLRVFVGKQPGMPASTAAKYSFNTSGTFTANKVEGQGFEAKKGTSVANFFKSTNDLGTSVGGSVGRELEVQILDGARRMYFQDWASCLYIAGSFSGPEMHSNLQATCQINSQGLQATPKGNVKSLRKISTGAVQATYNTEANVFVGSPPVPVACTNEGDSLAKGFCTAKGDGGSWATFTVRRYSTSGSVVEGSSQCIVGHPITETLKNTRDIDLAFETEKAEKLHAMMEHANNTEWYDADGEGLSGSEVVWVSPTDSGVVVQRSLTASEDSQDHYPDTNRILHNDLPKEEWLFDAWKLDGKKVIVDLDKAKADALATLKNQARFYLPRVSCLAGIFDEDDDMQKLKDLILGFKSKISDRSVTVTQLNEIMGQIRQEGLGCFAFREY